MAALFSLTPEIRQPIRNFDKFVFLATVITHGTQHNFIFLY